MTDDVTDADSDSVGTNCIASGIDAESGNQFVQDVLGPLRCSTTPIEQRLVES